MAIFILIPLLPLIAFLTLALSGCLLGQKSHRIATPAVGLSFALSAAALVSVSAGGPISISLYRLIEVEDANADMEQTDVVLVIGANDIVNPAARYDKASPIFGMPIIDADKARTVFAIKRSMNPGFAGIENELYYRDNCLMLFGDAKAVVGDLVKEFTGEGGGH